MPRYPDETQDSCTLPDRCRTFPAAKKIKRLGPDCLTVRPGGAGRPRADPHRILSGIVYWLRSAPAWRDLPTDFGPWSTVYHYWRLFNSSGLLARIHRAVVKPRGRLRMIDATFIKVHQHAANGVGTPESRGIGKTKGGKTTKLHAVVDEDGTLACFSLSPGNLNDCKAAPELLSQLSYKIILADKAYDTNALRELIAEIHSSACIPPKQNRNEPYPYDSELYKLRHVVENAFQRLKVFRSVDTRFQKNLGHVEGAVFFASTLLALNYRVASR